VLPRPVLNKAERPRQCRANEGYFITSQDKKLANVLAIYGQVDEGRLESTPADTGISVVNMVAAAVSAWAAVAQIQGLKDQEPVVIKCVTPRDKLVNLLDLSELAEAQTVVLLPREELRPYLDWQALQQFILRQLGLSRRPAEVVAVVPLLGDEERVPLGPTCRVKTLVDAVKKFEVDLDAS